MSDFEGLKEKPKAKRILRRVTFDFKGAHIAYTDASQGGAASLKNTPYLLKAKEIEKELTKEQEEILQAIGEESTPLDKSKSSDVDNNAPSSSTEVAGGEDDTVNKQKEDTMSEILEKKLAEMEHKVAFMEVEKSLGDYQLEAELNKELAEAVALLEKSSQEVVFKALTVLVARNEEKLEKALAEKEEKGANELEKALSEEAGHPKAEEIVEKSFVESVAEAKAELLKEAK